jgi:predicted PurR-regulated permease PerM
MSALRSLAFWIGIFAAVIAATVLLREILLPFVAGMVLAYLLDPLANRLERSGMSRLIATLTIIGLFVAGVVALCVLTAPIIVDEVVYFIDRFPGYVRQLQALATDPSRPWLSKIIGEGLGHAEQSMGELTTLASDWFGAVLRSVWSGGQALISVFSLAVVTPVVAGYLIYDWDHMVVVVDNWVPPAQRDTVRVLAREIDGTIRGYVIGQGALCLIMGLFYAVALSLIGLNHSLFIGVAAGLVSFIPYLGSLAGLLVATCVGVAQFWPNWTPVLFVPAIFFVGQTVADYVLSPYLVSRRVNLNPVWVMFALFAFGYLFGFVGLLIAVPLAAAIGVLMRFALRHYYASPIYAAMPAASTTDEGKSARSGKAPD